MSTTSKNSVFRVLLCLATGLIPTVSAIAADTLPADKVDMSIRVSVGEVTCSTWWDDPVSTRVLPRAMIQVLTRAEGTGTWVLRETGDLTDSGAFQSGTWNQPFPCDLMLRLRTESDHYSNDHVRVLTENNASHVWEHIVEGLTVYDPIENAINIEQLRITLGGSQDVEFFAFYAFGAAQDAWQFIESQTGESIAGVEIIYPDPEEYRPRYDCGEELMYLPLQTDWDWDRLTVLHEYGHHIQCDIYGYTPWCEEGGVYHEVCAETCAEFAFAEGWANFIQAAVDGNPIMFDNIETMSYSSRFEGGPCQISSQNGCTTEGAISGLLWDVYDGPNETHDTIDGGLNIDHPSHSIWDAMRLHKPDTIEEFGQALAENEGPEILNSLTTAYSGINCSVDLVPCNIEITTLLDGSEWMEGSLVGISWSGDGCGGNVSIELLRNGVPCATLADSTPNDGATVVLLRPANGAGAGYSVRVTDLETLDSAVSQGGFAINAAAGFYDSCDFEPSGPSTAQEFGDDLVLVTSHLYENDTHFALHLWDGVAWHHHYFDPFYPEFNVDLSGVYDMVEYKGQLIIGGALETVDGEAVNHLVSWDGSSFAPLGRGVNGHVQSLTVSGDQLIVGGGFTEAGGSPAANIAAWDGVTWSPLGAGPGGVPGVLASNGDEIWAASSSSPSMLTRWDGATWQSVESHLNLSAPYYHFGVNALIAWDSSVYVGGYFVTGEGTFALGRWDGTSWEYFAETECSLTSRIWALSEMENKLVIGGAFTSCPEFSSLMVYDGIVFTDSDVDFGTPYHAVGRLTKYGSNMVVEGTFQSVDGVPRCGLAILGPESILPGYRPTAAFTASPLYGNAPLDVQFVDRSTPGNTPITDWLWDLGDGQYSTLQSPNHTFAAGTYTVRLTVTNSAGSDSIELTGLVTALPPYEPPTVSFDVAPTMGKAPLLVHFTDTTDPGSAPIESWLWSFGDGAESSEQSPSHVYTEPGVRTVSLSVSTSYGDFTEVIEDVVVVTGIPITGLVGRWPFDGSAADVSGNGHHGHAVGVSWGEGVGGVPGSAAVFERDLGSYIAVDHTDQFDFSEGPWAIAFWVWHTDFVEPFGNYGYLTTYDETSDSGISLTTGRVNDVRYFSSGWWATGCSPLQSLTSVENNRWDHVVVQRSDVALEMWVNGVLEHSLDEEGCFWDASAGPEIVFGAYTGHTGNLNGKLDDMRIYNRSLSRPEIAFLQQVPSTVSSVPEESTTPSATRRLRNYPNPFNPQTTIVFESSEQEALRLCVFDITGRLIRTLVAREVYDQGTHEITWTGRDDSGRKCASGTYFCRLEAESSSVTRRMVLLK